MGKKLYKSSENSVICGICGGIGEFFNVDPVVIRIAWVIFCCLGASGIIAYIIAAIIIPKRPRGYSYDGDTEPIAEAYRDTYGKE